MSGNRPSESPAIEPLSALKIPAADSLTGISTASLGAGTRCLNILSVLFSFKGQISRKTYWLSIIIFFVWISLCGVVGMSVPKPFDAAAKGLIAFSALFGAILFFSLQVRRCNDIGWPGWLALLSFVPVIHWFWWCLLGFVTDKNFEKAKISGAKLGNLTQECLTRKSEERKAKEEMLKARDYTKMNKLISNYGQYKKLTVKKDWAGICDLNNVDIKSSKVFTRKEMNHLPEQLQPGEVVFCFTAGILAKNADSNRSDFGISTWVVVLTDRRFLFLDAAMLTNSVDVHSILHKNVQAVRVAQGFFLGKINIDTGGRTTLIDNCEKKTVKVLAKLANEWLQVLEERKLTPHEFSAAPVESELDQLMKLGELKNLGVLSEQEFSDAKAKVLESFSHRISV